MEYRQIIEYRHIKENIKIKEIGRHLRLCLTGTGSSIDLLSIFYLLGCSEIIKRIPEFPDLMDKANYALQLMAEGKLNLGLRNNKNLEVDDRTST